LGISITRKPDEVLIEEDIYIQLINYDGLNKQRQPAAEQLLTVAAEPEEQIPYRTIGYYFR